MEGSMNINPRQLLVIVILFTLGTTILVIPSGLAADAKQDAWLAAILGLVFNIGVIWLISNAGRSFPGKTLVEANELVFGKWIGALFTCGFLLFSFVGAATVLFYMGNFMNTQVMPETPIEAINILYAAIVVMGLRLGPETLARAAEIFFPWVILLFLILVVCIAPQIDLQKIEPVWEAGTKSVVKAALSVAGTASLPMIVLLMIYPAHVTENSKAKRAFLLGTFIGGVIFVIITFLCVSVLGPELTAIHMFPSYTLAKKINIGQFLQRIEIVTAGIWFITVYFKTTFYFYGFVAGLAQLLKIKDYRPLVLPSGVLLVLFSLVVYPNTIYMAKFDSTVFIPYALTFGLILPLLLLAVKMMRKL